MANTAAASVDETIEPTSRPVRRSNPSARHINTPTRPAVTTTPRVDRRMPRPSTGRTAPQWVSRPPANRINASATVPIRLAAWVLLKVIPPGPSDPASMPMQRNTISVGTPARSDTRLARMLARTRNPITRRINAGSIMNTSSSMESLLPTLGPRRRCARFATQRPSPL